MVNFFGGRSDYLTISLIKIINVEKMHEMLEQ